MTMTIVGQGPMQGFRVAATSELKIRAMAGNVRRTLGVNGPRFDAEVLLEKLSTFGITVDVIDDSDPSLPRGVEACWVPDIATLTIRATVYFDACRNDPRALFTIAHELGHLALGHRRTFNREITREIKTFEDSEWQANTFAAEFLMPLDQIRAAGLNDPSSIAIHFGVSSKAATVRINKLRAKNLI